jgi:hypothetical protein
VSTATLAPAPTVREHGDLPAHYTCCDENTAMCGTQLAAGVVITDEDPATDCPLCVYVWDNNLPCPAPGCPCGGA